MQIRALTYFRAIAILFIVGGHFLTQAGFVETRLDMTLWRNFIEGGTTFFVFISGFLFHRVFAPRFDYTRFLRGKMRNVLLPYLILSVPVAAMFLTIAPLGWDFFFETPRGEGVRDGVVLPWLQLLATGRHATAYWYVPFVILLFFCAPLHMRFIQLGTRAQLALTLGGLAVALLVQKPIYEINKLHALVYYTPIYLIGILTSLHWDRLRPAVMRHSAVLFATAAVLLVAMTFDGALGNYRRFADTPLVSIDLMMLQKITLSFAILGLLCHLEARDLPFLDEIAERSFAIFFLHPILILLFEASGLLPDLGWHWANYVMWFIAVFGGSYVIAGGARGALGSRSRLILGY